MACLLLAQVVAMPTLAAAAEAPDPLSYDWFACEDQARRLEEAEKIPALLLTAVTYTETGRRGPEGRRIRSWPWTLYADGKSFRFSSKLDAAKAVRRLMADGVKNIDVGCMQINLRYHPHAFTSVEEALDPLANLTYGVAFLKRQKSRQGSWISAIAHYHSANSAVNERYRRKVFAVWDQLRRKSAGERVNNAVSAVGTPRHQNDHRLTPQRVGDDEPSLLARRVSLNTWTRYSNKAAISPPTLRESLGTQRFPVLPFQKHLPHARIIVELNPHRQTPDASGRQSDDSPKSLSSWRAAAQWPRQQAHRINAHHGPDFETYSSRHTRD